MQAEKEYDLLAIGDAGRLLNLSTSALRNWVAAGELKCLVASDGSRLFTEKHVEDFRRRMAKRKAARAQARIRKAEARAKAVVEKATAAA